MQALISSPIEKDYKIHKEFVAGIVLVGHEIKHLLLRLASFKDAWIDFKPLRIKGLHINGIGSAFSADPNRERLILLSKNEIRDLIAFQKQGYAILVKSVVYLNRKAKIVIAVCKKLKKGDKRENEKLKEFKKEIKEFY